jgi:hypothetical protein
MATRLKIYYPESEIETGLFTIGKEWMLIDTWEEYVGSYHKYQSTGEVFTEPMWDKSKSRRLIPYKDKPSSYHKYQELVNYTIVNGERKEYYASQKMDRYTAPVPTFRYPIDAEISDGVMIRYFLIKRNEPSTRTPIEIDKKQADTYDTYGYGLNDILYQLVKVKWKLVGPEFDITENGRIIEYGVVDTNSRSVLEVSKKFPILKRTFTDMRQYTQYDVTYSIRYRNMHTNTIKS